MKLDSLILLDGRKLSYAEYGKTDGTPVFYFHGTPGSHLRHEHEILLAKQTGIRLIVPDRPGYGYSDFHPNRTLLDWADDMVALADTLGLARFGIIGFSGGGPHAMACANKIPHRLTKVAIISGLGPVVLLGEVLQPMTHERRKFKANQVMTDAENWFNSFVGNIPGSDGELIKAQGVWWVSYMQEAYRQGVDGSVYDETLILTQPWGFDLEDIKANVNIWYGSLDGVVPVHHAQYMTDHIANSTLTVIPEAGHLMSPTILKSIFESF
jgi:pimeloyl-ACP methyl ester carboxylesterase